MVAHYNGKGLAPKYTDKHLIVYLENLKLLIHDVL